MFPLLVVWQGNNVTRYEAAGDAVATLGLAEWTHLAATYNATGATCHLRRLAFYVGINQHLFSGTVTFYVDGMQHGTEISLGAISILSPLNTVWFKACVDSNPCHITDARIYGKPLGGDTVKKLYEGSKADVDCPAV